MGLNAQLDVDVLGNDAGDDGADADDDDGGSGGGGSGGGGGDDGGDVEDGDDAGGEPEVDVDAADTWHCVWRAADAAAASETLPVCAATRSASCRCTGLEGHSACCAC